MTGELDNPVSNPSGHEYLVTYSFKGGQVYDIAPRDHEAAVALAREHFPELVDAPHDRIQFSLPTPSPREDKLVVVTPGVWRTFFHPESTTVAPLKPYTVVVISVASETQHPHAPEPIHRLLEPDALYTTDVPKKSPVVTFVFKECLYCVSNPSNHDEAMRTACGLFRMLGLPTHDAPLLSFRCQAIDPCDPPPSRYEARIHQYTRSQDTETRHYHHTIHISPRAWPLLASVWKPYSKIYITIRDPPIPPAQLDAPPQYSYDLAGKEKAESEEKQEKQ